MTIHHNTIKRAAALGLKISVIGNVVTIEGEIIPGILTEWKLADTSAKDALQAAYQARVYAKEYKLEITQSATGTFRVSIPGGQYVQGTDLLDVLTRAVEKATARQQAETSVKLKVSKPAKVKSDEEDGEDEEGDDGEDEEGDDGEEIAEEEVEEEEPGASGSVVKDKYRELYAQKGHPDNCGDDLAAQLAAILKPGEEGLDIDRLWALAQANGIEYTKYMTGNRGWEGRARMSIGNVLRGRIRRGEEVVLEIR
jgi:hypothetical protein